MKTKVLSSTIGLALLVLTGSIFSEKSHAEPEGYASKAARLQSELTEAKAQITKLTDKAKSDAEDYESKMDDLKSQLAKAKDQAEKLLPFAKRGAVLPVKYTVRNALTGDGKVLIIENFSGSSIPVKVTLSNSSFDKTKSYNLVFNGAHITPTKKEIGHLEGWAFAPGDTFEFSSEGYMPAKGAIE